MDSNSLESQDNPPPRPESAWLRFYRSTIFQMGIVGIISFSGPAMFDALAGLGGGGAAEPWAVNLSSSLNYVFMALVCVFGGPIVNRIGPKYALIIGSATFPLIGSSLYVNSKYGTQWYMIFGYCINGIGTALWYVAEAGIILSYPERNNRGKMLGAWIIFRNSGQLVGGAINLATNSKADTEGSVAVSTYLIFVALECLAFPCGFLLSPADKVVRKDGTRIQQSEKMNTVGELKKLGQAFRSKHILLIILFSFYSFFYISVYGTYLTLNFSVRARALSSLISPTFCIVGCLALGFVLDIKTWSQKKRAIAGFLIVFWSAVGIYIWTFIVQADITKNNPGVFDWNDPGWFRAFGPYFFINTFGPMGQSYIYWLISCFATDIQSNSRNGGIFRAFEAVGQAVAYGINSKKGGQDYLWVGFGVNTGLLILGSIPLVFLVLNTPDISPMAAAELEKLESEQYNQSDIAAKDKLSDVKVVNETA